MADRHIAVELPARTLVKVVAAAAIVWVWLQLYELFLLLTVAILLAVTLDPLVTRLQTRGLPRWGASTLVGFTLAGALIVFLVVTGTSLVSEAQLVGGHLSTVEHQIVDRLPQAVHDSFGFKSAGVQQYLQTFGIELLRSTTGAAIVIVLAFILTMYLLIEGAKTFDWLVAFVPKARRPKVEETAIECQRVIFAYALGNVATSMFAGVFVMVGLAVLRVPGALLLAVLAGLCDFVPVLGFVISAVPGVLVASTVSVTTGIIATLLYLTYHFLENYYIGPRVYGQQLRLSNVAVVLAFAAGAALAGVVGALIALPVAAVYPAVERIWLREELGDNVVREHRAIEHRKAG